VHRRKADTLKGQLSQWLWSNIDKQLVEEIEVAAGEAEAGGSKVLGQPGLHSETLSQTNIQKKQVEGHWWPTPIILATQEAEIRRILV
jgi:hypothetical protein